MKGLLQNEWTGLWHRSHQGSVHFSRWLQNFLHITRSVSISNRKCCVFECLTEQLIHSPIRLEVPCFSNSCLQYPLYLFRSLWFFIQLEKRRGKNTNFSQYPSQRLQLCLIFFCPISLSFKGFMRLQIAPLTPRGHKTFRSRLLKLKIPAYSSPLKVQSSK